MTLKVSKSQALRDSNIELYRIISMLLIVAHHYVVNSGLTAANGPIYSNTFSFPSLFLLLFGAWGKIGINCFVLITGYFMCKSQITPKKFAKLFLEVMFYQFVINIIFWIFGYAPFTLKSFLKVLVPFTSISKNFTGTYLIFFLCIPFLNVLVNNLNQKQHIRLLLLSFSTYVLFGTVPFLSVTMNYVSWYMVLYFIASYIRLYPKKIFDSKRFWGIMTFISVSLSAISVVACSWLGAKLGTNIPFLFVTDSNTFLAVLTGLSSFMLFKNIKIKYNKFINTVSATTFGILLIHANSDAMRQWLWKDLFNNVGMYGSSIMPIHAISSVIIVFVVCSLLDLARIHLIEKPFFKLWDKYWHCIAEKFTFLENNLFEKFKKF
ncbi:MAG: acyltransferase [Ruminococcaceae bacterium]|nr:acyltransferase [Oscillospiraceae bacterium]